MKQSYTIDRPIFIRLTPVFGVPGYVEIMGSKRVDAVAKSAITSASLYDLLYVSPRLSFL